MRARRVAALSVVLALFAPFFFTAPDANGATGYDILASVSPDRAAPASLEGQTVTDDIYAFASPDEGVKRVRFYLDDTARSGPARQNENQAPYDFAGTTNTGAAFAFDTTTVADGSHTITAEVETTARTTEVVHATFTVDNHSPALAFDPSPLAFAARVGDGPSSQPTTLSASDGTAASFALSDDAEWLTVDPASGTTPSGITVTADPADLPAGTYTATVVASADGYLDTSLPVTLTVSDADTAYEVAHSATADRSSPTGLHGDTVTGDLFAFTQPDTDVARVRFYLDDTAMSGTPHQVESAAPYDFAGTADTGDALPFDTTTVPDGEHTVTAAVETASGTTDVVHATFTVANNAPSLTFDAASLSMAADEGTGPTSATTTLATNDDAEAAFAISSDASWLTADPASGNTPASITVAADTASLEAGSHTATLTASSDTHEAATLPVEVTIDSTGCSPIACEDIMVDLPYELDFSADHGHLADGAGVGTGFTWVDPPSNGRGYLPENLSVDTEGGQLQITTTKGLASGSANSLDNGLSVGIDAPSQISVLDTTLVSPPTGSGKYEQAGLWFGNNEDNYVKMVVQSAPDGTRIEHLLEVDGAREGQTLASSLDLSSASVALSLRADPSERTVTASYSVNGGAKKLLGTYTVPGEFFSFDAAGIDPRIGTRTFGGVFASHRNGPSPLVYDFDGFSVTAAPPEVPQSALQFDSTSFPVSFPTSMVWGPDDRLYVTELFGDVHAITLDETKSAVADEVITTVGNRLTLGLAVDPDSTPDNVVLWVAHSSPSLDNGEVNSSTVSRLSGDGFATKDDVITGLPRAKANHAVNSLKFGPDGRLYIAAGGNTGAGAPNTANTEFGDRPEQPLSAALLVADVKAAGFEGACATPLYEFGVPETCDVSVFSSGLRNMYDFVHHSNGRMYGPDNGLGVTGTYPPSPEPDCSGLADTSEHNPGEQPDTIHLLEEGRHYGHPNPYRNECVFKDGTEQGVAAPANYTPPIHDLGMNRSANGTIEYRGEAFCGAMDGDLLIANYSVGDNLTRVQLSDDGTSVEKVESLVGGFNDPLPLTQGPDGTIYVGEFGGGRVTALQPQDLGCWESREPLPVKILDAGGAALDGKVYAVGGKTSAGPHSTVYAYDPATDTYATTVDLPGEAVENPAVVDLNGKLYAFGGSTDPFSGAVANAAAYDPAADAWTPLADMPTPRGGAAAQAVDGRIYVVGGMGADGASVDTVEVYDPATDTWTAGGPMMSRRDNPGAAVLDGRLHVFGGRIREADGTTVNGTLNTVEMFDAAADEWVSRASMPTGRRTMVVGTLNGRAQLMGGEIRSDGGSFSENEEFDPASQTWRVLTRMPSGRHGAAAGTVDGTVHVLGGGLVGGGSYSDINEAFTFLRS